MNPPRFILAVVIVAILAGPAIGADVKAGALQISAAWARATPKGATIGGGYMTITNSGTISDRLIGGSSAVSDKIELHEMSMDNGVMKMRPLASGLEIKPGQTATLTPGGMHMMFVGLKQPLTQGQTFKVTLEFEKAGKVEVDYPIAGIGARGPGGDNTMKGMSGMGGMKH
ncbi:MAG: copper chaperone PCu(A)C [Pseudolabrys sp.]